ncbi:MAG: metal ABC transporter substrate-binding protein [Verrucomicrobiales bacterium]
MARLAKVVAEALAAPIRRARRLMKAGARRRARAVQGPGKWARYQIAAIPKSDRKLVTAHAAFGYFCKEYGFRFVPVMGLAREEDYSPKFIAEALEVIRREKIRAVFPEDQANPKILKELAQQAGVAVAEPLIADGTTPGEGSTFEGMLRHNVAAIVKALAPRG